MKVTDAFTLFHKSNPSPPAQIGEGIKPVSVIDKLSLQPGQLFRGEVLGEDANGHLLLKVGGEIIVTRGLVSMTMGQQVWVEVKDVGDSPLFALAQAKGAVHELLKNIMEVRPAVLAQTKGAGAVALEFQTPLEPQGGMSFVPKLAPLHDGGTLPRETTQLLKALLALPKAEIPALSEAQMKQLAPFLSAETGTVDVGKVVTVLSETGKLPPVLGELAPLRSLFMFKGTVEQPTTGTMPVDESLAKPQLPVMGPRPIDTGSVVATEKTPVPFITTDGQVVSHAVQVVRSLVEAVSLLANQSKVAESPVSESLSKGFTDLVKSIMVEGKIPETLRNLEPVKLLFQIQAPVEGKGGSLLKPMTSDDFIQGFSQTSMAGKVLSPVEHNETVAKIISGLQGAEPKPELLRVLKQLVSLAPMAQGDDETADESRQTARLSESALGVAKAASFFKSQAVVNQEVVHVTQGDCVLVPCFFVGQSGWGEWMWSHEQQEGQDQEKENLAFFLEMSNLGPVSIQAILGEKSLSGQFQVADNKAYSLIVEGLPLLEERLAALGYDAHFTCRQKPVAVMQDIKEALEGRTTSVPTSLVDIQA